MIAGKVILNSAKSISILYQCPHFIVVNKPPFCYSQPPDTSRSPTRHNPSSSSLTSTKDNASNTVLALLASSHPNLFNPTTSPFCAPKLVHRLDYEVSGAMVLATSVQAAKWLSRNLKYGGSKGSIMEKHYVALLLNGRNSEDYDGGRSSNTNKPVRTEAVTEVHERERGRGGSINLPINERPSLTQYWIPSVQPENRSNNGALIGVFKPITGRKHQIRIHAALGLGMPILGDSKYGSTNTHFSKNRGLALHSAMVNIKFGNSQVCVKAPINWNHTQFWTPYLDHDNFLINNELYQR